MELLYPFLALIGISLLCGLLIAFWDEKKPKIEKKKREFQSALFLSDEEVQQRLKKAKQIYKLFDGACNRSGGLVLVSPYLDDKPNDVLYGGGYMPRYEDKGRIWFHVAVEYYDYISLDKYFHVVGCKTVKDMIEMQNKAKVEFIENTFAMSYEKVVEIIDSEIIMTNAEIRKGGKVGELEFSYSFPVPDEWDYKTKSLFIEAIRKHN